MAYNTPIQFMFKIIPVIIILIIIATFIFYVLIISQNVKKRKKNNTSPTLTVDAIVVAKRMDIRNYNYLHAKKNIMHHYENNSIYFVTFEVQSGDRMELEVPNTEYGILLEHDQVKLTFQGTRYISSERHSFQNQ